MQKEQKKQNLKKIRRDLALLLHEKCIVKNPNNEAYFFINSSLQSCFETPLSKQNLASYLKLKPYKHCKDLHYNNCKFPIAITHTKTPLELINILTTKTVKRIYYAQVFYYLLKQHLHTIILFKSSTIVNLFFKAFKTILAY